MRKFLAASLLAIAAVSANAQALEYTNPLDSGLNDALLFEAAVTQVHTKSPLINTSATIGIARLDGGRLIPTPHSEEVDWTFLDRRMDTKIQQLGASNYINYIPEIAFQGQDTDNKIDEIRLTAANEGMDYVIIYGVGPDASWASFGKKALSETGLTVHKDCKSWEQAKAKALLVDSYTGEVLGAVTADDITYNIGQLADRVGEMITELSAPQLTEA